MNARRCAELMFAAVLMVAATARAEPGRVIDIETAAELQQALATPVRNTTLRLAPGEYHLEASPGVDSTCGNCEDPNQTVPITIGLHVRGDSVVIVGPQEGGAVVYTHAGYGVFFEGCTDCAIENVTLTGGVRDTSPDATDAAVVVKHSTVGIRRCEIRDNIGDADLIQKNVVGIIGVCAREGANVTVWRCRILRNSWDGIALYRDATARIYQNLIDGVDKARGKEIGGGRGVGIGATWNAKARVENNLVRRYWKGIGIFVDAEVQVVSNIVEEILTWGIACWDAGKGEPSAAIGGNVIFDCGACGASVTREAPLREGDYLSFTQNLVVKTGQDPKYDDPESYCQQCALAVQSAPDGFRVSGNVFHDNRRASDDLPDYDVPDDQFQQGSRTIINRILRNAGADVTRDLFRESAFLKQFAE